MKKINCLVLVIVCVYVMSCDSPPGRSKSSSESFQPIERSSVSKGQFKPFYVYSNKGSAANHFVPSGFMPNGECVKINDRWMENCFSERTCIQIDYQVECSRRDMQWGGIYWQNPANNWGNRKGGFNLEGAQKLTFWARGEKGGEQIQEFLVGGISGDYPDSDVSTIGPVILSDEWRQYTIDLRGKDLSFISGGFGWTTSADANEDTCVFYLDDIRYE